MPDHSLDRSAAAPAEPTSARRLRPPSWRDPRLGVGVVLVLGSVVAGGQIVASADDTVPIYVAARTLNPGERLGSDDVSVARVRISKGEGRYLPATGDLADDQVVLRLVPAGELVARSAVGARDEVDIRPLSVPVRPESAAGLDAGVLVDVWVAARDPQRGGESYQRPSQVAANAQVSGRSVQRSALGSSTTASVQLLLTPDLVPKLIEAIDNGARITLVPVPATVTGGGS